MDVKKDGRRARCAPAAMGVSEGVFGQDEAALRKVVEVVAVRVGSAGEAVEQVDARSELLFRRRVVWVRERA
jgi:hypothetical protein